MCVNVRQRLFFQVIDMKTLYVVLKYIFEESNVMLRGFFMSDFLLFLKRLWLSLKKKNLHLR